MNDVKFRKAKECEIKKIYELCEEIKKDYPLWDDEYPVFDNFLESYEEDGLYVLCINSEIIGSISLETSSWRADSISISRFMVKEEYRRHGYGRLMFSKIENVIRERGFEYADLFTRNDHPFAIKMYEKLGYQNLGKFDTKWCDNITEYYYLFVKKLK